MFRLFSAYNRLLHKYPLPVTSLTTGACYGAGDYLAQKIEIKQGKRTEIDTHRLSVFTLFGVVLGGPIYYTWFSKIDKMPILVESIVKWNQQRYLTNEFRKQLSQHITKNNVDKLSMQNFRVQYKNTFDLIEKPMIRSKTILVSKIYADQFIFSVFYPIFFMLSTGVLLENSKKEDLEYIKTNKKLNTEKIKNSFNKSVENVKNKFAKIYVADCAVWPLIQMANFAFIPSQLQPIFVNTVNIFWNAFICYVSQDGGH
jgi:hypothetical protein